MWKEGAYIDRVQTIDQQLRKFVDAGEEIIEQMGNVGIGECHGHFRVVVANHGDTGSRRNADDFGAGKGSKEMTHQREGLALVTGVVVHLTTASLGRSEFDSVAETLQYPDDGFAGRGKQGVVVAGDEQ
jgi:hypothetical protein